MACCCCVTQQTLNLVSNKGKGLSCCGKQISCLPTVESSTADILLGDTAVVGDTVENTASSAYCATKKATSSFWQSVKDDFNLLPSWKTIALIVFLLILVVVFVYSFSAHLA